MSATRVGVVGASGYTGGEVLRLLLDREEPVELAGLEAAEVTVTPPPKGVGAGLAPARGPETPRDGMLPAWRRTSSVTQAA